MKYITLIFSILIVSFGGGVLIASATQGYVPLAPLPLGPGGSVLTNYTLASYIPGMIKLLIAVGGAMAILMAIIGGTQYVAASINPSAKSDAREKIENSLIGLAIILSSYLLLNSINPKLVNFNSFLPPVKSQPAPAAPAVSAVTTPAPTATTWYSDTTERNSLLPVTVNKDNCTATDKNAPGGSNCTSVYGLMSDVITKIKAVQVACNCAVLITGGTESWLHQTHGNKRNVDLHQDGGALDFYIRSGIKSDSGSCGIFEEVHYAKNGAIYVDEPDKPATTGRHWHVCY